MLVILLESLFWKSYRPLEFVVVCVEGHSERARVHVIAALEKDLSPVKLS